MSPQIPLRFGFVAAALWLSATHALAQDAPDSTLTLKPAELKVIAKAMAARPTPQTLPLVIKLQAQINAQFPPGPGPTDLPLPAIEGWAR
jgi:hypothetical protein